MASLPSQSNLEDKAAAALEALMIKREKEVQAILKTTLDEIRVTMAVIYDKYASGDILSRADMTQYNRMASLEDQLLASLNPAIKSTTGIINRLPSEAYQEAFFQYAWALDNSSSIRLNYGMLNKESIAKIVESPFSKISLERYGQQARTSVKMVLAQAIAQGNSYNQTIKTMKKALTTTAFNAFRILRTEAQTAMNAGQDAAYKKAVEKGVEGQYIWDATLDGRTRPTHAAIDGQPRDEKTGKFTLGQPEQFPRYPGDEVLTADERINCRCRLRFQVAGYSPALRRTRDQGLIPYQTYNEWIKGAQ